MTNEERQSLKEKLKERIELSVMIICVVIIVICAVYAYIVQPVKQPRVKSTLEVGFVSVPVVDTAGTFPDPDTLIYLGDNVYTMTYKDHVSQ